MRKFEIIKNSESNTGYQIEDKEFKGIIPGVCCGWQYEYIDSEGHIAYSSVTYCDESAEDYAYRWTDDNGRSWLLDGLNRNDYDFTGRVIFRGYGYEYYDAEERDWFIREL